MKQELRKIILKNKFKLIIEFFILILMVYFTTFPAKYLGRIIDLLNDMGKNRNLIMQNVFIMLVSSFAIIMLRFLHKYIEYGMEMQIKKILKDHLYQKFMKMRLQDINEIKNGELLSYFVRDINKIAEIGTRFYSTGVRVIINMIIVITLMSNCGNINLTVCAVIPILITIVTLTLIREEIKNSVKQAQKNWTKFSEFVQENTDGIRTIKAFSGEEQELDIFKEKVLGLKNSNLKVSINQSLLDIMINVGIGISYVIAIMWGSKLVITDKMSIGGMVSFLGYLSLLDWPMLFVPWILSKIDEFKIALFRLDKAFKLPEEKIEIQDINVDNKIAGDIRINNLSFGYPKSADQVLSNISIDLKKGETLGIIGTVGSGKTTLMNLLLKLYNIPRGNIMIGGFDINDIPIEVLRNSICYITQDNFLFSATIKENISLFKENFKDEEIYESTRKTFVYDEVKKMQNGIYTKIGEKGIDLSGGQKQRVALSRAFVDKFSIVIFDDTFSALDNKTEQKVLESIKELIKDKTCIIISNRILDIEDCDKIIVMDKGKIVEQGTHSSLIQSDTNYYKVYKHQSQKAVILD